MTRIRRTLLQRLAIFEAHGGRCHSETPSTRLDWLRSMAAHQGDACLPWPFGTARDWYATVHVTDGVFSKAHRVMCELAHGTPLAGQVARHSCGNKRCVNPRHLSWGSQKDNVADAIRDGAIKRGSAVSRAKLTEEDVRVIRAARSEGATYSELGQRYGISKGAIWHAVQGSQWGHVK